MMLESGIIASMRPETDMCTTLRGCSCKKTLQAEQVELSLDSDILEALLATGKDWEAHFNAILREWLRLNSRVLA
ncbi:MAG: BrnA antitoxin family protein [Betaproteobacteria bacterium]|nr:BrnA antitoxin family protein [Betaproteobacteria bacterium]